MKRSLGGLLAVLVAAAPAAAAAGTELPVPVQQYESIRYYSGGVGSEERRDLPQLYPLKVVFRTDAGHLLCDADVTIAAGGKTVFRGRAENGPWLVVDLPPGAYDVTAVQDGASRTAIGVRLAKGKQRTVVMTWKVSEVDMGL
ncbi:MAG TPA: hypothetical protein VN317_10400 [Candidatus Methanoperedens sp.]|nr:hypothetical protein [Candidatus Methanoperedens sp.]